MLHKTILASFFLLLASHLYASADNKVGITDSLMQVEVLHQGKKITIMREQDDSNMVAPDFALTSRYCPPFCVQPIKLAGGIETLGELEVLDYLKQKAAGNNDILVIDSRTPDWVAKGTIPSSINVPWSGLSTKQGATTESIIKLMDTQLGIKLAKGIEVMDVDEAITEGTTGNVFNYDHAKTLILFCNGMWCGQSPTSITTLLQFGYPANKIKWFRGGMQTWAILGLTTIKTKK